MNVTLIKQRRNETRCRRLCPGEGGVKPSLREIQPLCTSKPLLTNALKLSNGFIAGYFRLSAILKLYQDDLTSKSPHLCAFKNALKPAFSTV